MDKRTKIGLGIGVGLVGLGTALYLRKRKKDESDKPEESIVPVKRKASISSLPAFKNYFGKGEYLTNFARGVRNNNPGNIIQTGILWKGEIPKELNTDGRFKQFYNYADGIRAIIVNLRAYYRKGYRTLKQIISTWAPPNENHTGKYIDFVAKYMGIPPEMPMNFDMQVIRKLTEAIIIYENRKLYLDPRDFEKAWNEIKKP